MITEEALFKMHLRQLPPTRQENYQWLSGVLLLENILTNKDFLRW